MEWPGEGRERDLLEGSGYAVIEAADGKDGVAKATTERPDLMLMHSQLRVLDGCAATRQIKVDPTLAKTPIIAVSSFAMKGDAERHGRPGCRSLRHQIL
jgi:two-component system cell cycle response regulator DivK